jgi:tetratricopeptide (TPR) repeat protein
MIPVGVVVMTLVQAGPDLEQGLAAFQRGDLEGARVALLRAVETKPSPQTWKTLGVVFASANDYTRAEPAFAEACRLDAREIDACYYWARALYALNRFEPSLAALDRVPPSSPRYWRVQLARGEALSALARAAEAEKQYQAALKARRDDPAPPSFIDPALSYAAHLHREGRIEESLATLRATPPAYARVAQWHYQVGRALLHLDRTEEAVEPLRRAVALQPVYPEAHTLLSKTYYRLGNAADGARHAELAAQGSSTTR